MKFQEGAVFTPMFNLKPTCHRFIKEEEDGLSSFHAPGIVLGVHSSSGQEHGHRSPMAVFGSQLYYLLCDLH